MRIKLTVVAMVFTFLLGWFANQALQPSRANAARTFQYKVFGPLRFGQLTVEDFMILLQRTLDTEGKQGWRLLATVANDNVLIFER